MTFPPRETKTFCELLIEQALEKCQAEGYQAQFMPQLVDERIMGKLPWDKGYSAPSIRATGRTKQGNAVVVYAHIPTSLATSEGIRQAAGVVTNTDHLLKDESQQLVDQDGLTDSQGNRLVWVIDYSKSGKMRSGRISIAQALEHSQTIPFLGGEKRAQDYLLAHAKAYLTDVIDIPYNVDLREDSFLARFLSLDYVIYKGIPGSFHFSPTLLSCGLSVDGDGFYRGGGRFFGIRQQSSEGSKK
ncbi:MAG: hypothetical protein Q8L34_00335 [Candidatus Woesearchaeota archaeon]|nr:hypothetical protein [Candidatus Woesearchaeota archaeon]